MAFNSLGHHTPLADRDYLVSLVRQHGVKQLVEVGCHVGMTTLQLVEQVRHLTVHAIDTFEGNQQDRQGETARRLGRDAVLKTFCQNVRLYLFDRVQLHIGTSQQYAEIWPRQIDMVYIDAEHTREAVERDIELWMPHVRHGGILAGHDYGVFEGVTAAVDRLVPDEVQHRVWMKRIYKRSRNGVWLKG